MKEKIGANIARYRKECKITQEELANQLHISYQAVSKWETGQSLPDIISLNKIAEVLHTNIENLMGYSRIYTGNDYYEKQYQKDGYFWGVQPSEMCLELLRLLPPSHQRIRVLDVGCGEGKDAVFLARCGYQVSAFDISETGIEKTRELANQAGVSVDAFQADVQDYRIEAEMYDIIFSSGVFQYMKPELRGEILKNYKKHTNANGIHAFHVFVDKPFIAPPPDSETEITFSWKSGEIMTHYHDWLIENSEEIIFDCNSSGIPHQHAANILFARKVGE